MEWRRELTGLCERDKCWARRNQRETELLALDRVEWSKLIRRREVSVSRELHHDFGTNLMEGKGTKLERGTWRLETNWDQIGHWRRGGGR